MFDKRSIVFVVCAALYFGYARAGKFNYQKNIKIKILKRTHTSLEGYQK